MGSLVRLRSESDPGIVIRLSQHILRPENSVVSEEQIQDITIQSQHPHDRSTSQWFDVRMPGAKEIKVVFDTRSQTKSDTLYFYKDRRKRQVFGNPHGYSGRKWPGVGKESPLLIPSDSFVVYFKTSNVNSNSWGFKFLASASSGTLPKSKRTALLLDSGSVVTVENDTALHLLEDVVFPYHHLSHVKDLIAKLANFTYGNSTAFKSQGGVRAITTGSLEDDGVIGGGFGEDENSLLMPTTPGSIARWPERRSNLQLHRMCMRVLAQILQSSGGLWREKFENENRQYIQNLVQYAMQPLDSIQKIQPSMRNLENCLVAANRVNSITEELRLHQLQSRNEKSSRDLLVETTEETLRRVLEKSVLLAEAKTFNGETQVISETKLGLSGNFSLSAIIQNAGNQGAIIAQCAPTGPFEKGAKGLYIQNNVLHFGSLGSICSLGDKVMAKYKGGSQYPATVVRLNEDGKITVNWEDGDGQVDLEPHEVFKDSVPCSGRGAVRGTTPVNDGKIHHVGVTHSEINHGAVALYVDGNLENSGTLQPGASPAGSVVKVGKGADDFPKPESGFKGNIQNPRLFTGVLTDTEMRALSREELRLACNTEIGASSRKLPPYPDAVFLVTDMSQTIRSGPRLLWRSAESIVELSVTDFKGRSQLVLVKAVDNEPTVKCNIGKAGNTTTGSNATTPETSTDKNAFGKKLFNFFAFLNPVEGSVPINVYISSNFHDGDRPFFAFMPEGPSKLHPTNVAAGVRARESKWRTPTTAVPKQFHVFPSKVQGSSEYQIQRRDDLKKIQQFRIVEVESPFDNSQQSKAWTTIYTFYAFKRKQNYLRHSVRDVLGGQPAQISCAFAEPDCRKASLKVDPYCEFFLRMPHLCKRPGLPEGLTFSLWLRPDEQSIGLNCRQLLTLTDCAGKPLYNIAARKGGLYVSVKDRRKVSHCKLDSKKRKYSLTVTVTKGHDISIYESGELILRADARHLQFDDDFTTPKSFEGPKIVSGGGNLEVNDPVFAAPLSPQLSECTGSEPENEPETPRLPLELQRQRSLPIENLDELLVLYDLEKFVEKLGGSGYGSLESLLPFQSDSSALETMAESVGMNDAQTLRLAHAIRAIRREQQRLEGKKEKTLYILERGNVSLHSGRKVVFVNGFHGTVSNVGVWNFALNHSQVKCAHEDLKYTAHDVDLMQGQSRELQDLLPFLHGPRRPCVSVNYQSHGSVQGGGSSSPRLSAGRGDGALSYETRDTLPDALDVSGTLAEALEAFNLGHLVKVICDHNVDFALLSALMSCWRKKRRSSQVRLSNSVAAAAVEKRKEDRGEEIEKIDERKSQSKDGKYTEITFILPLKAIPFRIVPPHNFLEIMEDSKWYLVKKGDLVVMINGSFPTVAIAQNPNITKSKTFNCLVTIHRYSQQPQKRPQEQFGKGSTTEDLDVQERVRELARLPLFMGYEGQIMSMMSHLDAHKARDLESEAQTRARYSEILDKLNRDTELNLKKVIPYVISIRAYISLRLEGVAFVLRGEGELRQYGSKKGSPSRFVLDKNEYINCVTGIQGSGLAKQLTFHTSNGRERHFAGHLRNSSSHQLQTPPGSPDRGVEGGLDNRFRFKAREGFEVVGLKYAEEEDGGRVVGIVEKKLRSRRLKSTAASSLPSMEKRQTTSDATTPRRREGKAASLATPTPPRSATPMQLRQKSKLGICITSQGSVSVPRNLFRPTPYPVSVTESLQNYTLLFDMFIPDIKRPVRMITPAPKGNFLKFSGLKAAELSKNFSETPGGLSVLIKLPEAGQSIRKYSWTPKSGMQGWQVLGGNSRFTYRNTTNNNRNNGIFPFPYALRDTMHAPVIVRSPIFYNPRRIRFKLLGGRGQPNPTDSGFLGVGLRRVKDGKYVKWHRNLEKTDKFEGTEWLLPPSLEGGFTFDLIDRTQGGADDELQHVGLNDVEIVGDDVPTGGPLLSGTVDGDQWFRWRINHLGEPEVLIFFSSTRSHFGDDTEEDEPDAKTVKRKVQSMHLYTCPGVDVCTGEWEHLEFVHNFHSLSSSSASSLQTQPRDLCSGNLSQTPPSSITLYLNGARVGNMFAKSVSMAEESAKMTKRLRRNTFVANEDELLSTLSDGEETKGEGGDDLVPCIIQKGDRVLVRTSGYKGNLCYLDGFATGRYVENGKWFIKIQSCDVKKEHVYEYPPVHGEYLIAPTLHSKMQPKLGMRVVAPFVDDHTPNGWGWFPGRISFLIASSYNREEVSPFFDAIDVRFHNIHRSCMRIQNTVLQPSNRDMLLCVWITRNYKNLGKWSCGCGFRRWTHPPYRLPVPACPQAAAAEEDPQARTGELLSHSEQCISQGNGGKHHDRVLSERN
eukprot:jgi/Bigna1/141140/aug1.60_g15848